MRRTTRGLISLEICWDLEKLGICTKWFFSFLVPFWGQLKSPGPTAILAKAWRILLFLLLVLLLQLMFIYSLRIILAGWLFLPQTISNQTTSPYAKDSHNLHMPPVVEFTRQEGTKNGVPSLWLGLRAVQEVHVWLPHSFLGEYCRLRQGSLSPFCRLCAHLLPGTVSDRPYEPRNGRQYLQVLHHVRPPRGLWAFCCQHEPRCCNVVQQAPPDICQCAKGSSTYRGNVTHCGQWPWQGRWAKALSRC